MTGMPAVERIDITPNCSLSVNGAVLFFGSVCAGSFGIAGLMALLGYWPILPFAGLEMALLGWALKKSLERRHHHETVTISETDVRIASRDRAQSREIVFPRYWARVHLRPAPSRLHPSRLTIASHGRQYEVGSFLTEEKRRALAQRLTRLISITRDTY